MSRLSAIFNQLKTPPQTEEDDSTGVPPEIPYTTIVAELKNTGISEMEILQDLRDVVVAHIAAGLVVYLDEGSPYVTKTGFQLQTEEGHELIGLFNAILEAQERVLKSKKDLHLQYATSEFTKETQEAAEDPSILSEPKAPMSPSG